MCRHNYFLSPKMTSKFGLFQSILSLLGSFWIYWIADMHILTSILNFDTHLCDTVPSILKFKVFLHYSRWKIKIRTCSPDSCQNTSKPFHTDSSTKKIGQLRTWILHKWEIPIRFPFYSLEKQRQSIILRAIVSMFD